MIRLTAHLKRNPALTSEEFLHHWHHVHGPLIRDTPALARHIVRYEQHPPTADRGAGLGAVDGVAVQWFESIDELFAMLAEPEYAEILHPDEQKLLDFTAMTVVFTAEPIVVIDGDVS